MTRYVLTAIPNETPIQSWPMLKRDARIMMLNDEEPDTLLWGMPKEQAEWLADLMDVHPKRRYSATPSGLMPGDQALVCVPDGSTVICSRAVSPSNGRTVRQQYVETLHRVCEVYGVDPDKLALRPGERGGKLRVRAAAAVAWKLRKEIGLSIEEVIEIMGRGTKQGVFRLTQLHTQRLESGDHAAIATLNGSQPAISLSSPDAAEAR